MRATSVALAFWVDVRTRHGQDFAFWLYLFGGMTFWCGLSLLYLPFSEFNIYALSIFAVFYGLDWIATVPPTVRLVATA